MKYLKDLLRVSVFVFIMYVPVMWWSTQKVLTEVELKQNLSVGQNLGTVAKSIQSLIAEKRIAEACQRLEAEYSAHRINLYSLNSNDGGCFEPEMVEDLNIAIGFSTVSEMTFYREQFQDVDWILSVKNPEKLYFIDHVVKTPMMRQAVVSELLSVIYIICAFVLLAVLIFTKSIQNRFKKHGQDPLWLKFINKIFGFLQLHDLKILDLATTEVIQEKDSLEKDIDLLETSLEFSILNEIKQKSKTVPYTFKGTVAKVDINGFSKVIALGDKQGTQNLTQSLEQFGCELLYRYQGLFEKTIGDEIVVVFKGENSSFLAAAFCRDLMKEFSELEFDFNSGAEKRKFTLKSAISSSEIMFSKRMSGYAFSGDALTFTTRLMDVVQIKDRNILSLMSDEALSIQDIVILSESPRVFEFKNMSAQNGYWIEQFLAVEQCYDQSPNHLIYFRSNKAIQFLLQKIQTESSIDKINLILDCFAKIKVRTTDELIIHEFIQSIIVFEEKARVNDRFVISFSFLISEGSKLIPAAQWSKACTDCLLSISRKIDGRINASIVEVLVDKNLFEKINENANSFILANDLSFRTRGNLLINQALQKLDQDIFNKILQMMNSKNVLESHTGIYCACHISQFYQNYNPAELSIYPKHAVMIEQLKATLMYKKAKNNDAVISERLQIMINKTIAKYLTLNDSQKTIDLNL